MSACQPSVSMLISFDRGKNMAFWYVDDMAKLQKNKYLFHSVETNCKWEINDAHKLIHDNCFAHLEFPHFFKGLN